jgi:orotidine-5'-phosphate decarboxylase
MKESTRVVILPMDGFKNGEELILRLSQIMASDMAKRLVGTIKLNDALHFPYVGPAILGMIDEILPAGTEKFIDLKIADVSDTNRNTLRHYRSYNPDIVTVTSTVSAKSLLAVKEALPDTKIALVDTLTDISAEEIHLRYGLDAAHKIAEALTDFEILLKSNNPIEIVVCSPRELAYLKEQFGDRYKFITPGIRSPHMAKDHQERVTSAYDALKAGAWRLVMGAQVTKGNPAKNVSAEESQRITLEEIEKFFAEQN